MCFYKNKNGTTVMHVANKDIVVYKITNKYKVTETGFEPYWMSEFKYLFGNTYNTNFDLSHCMYNTLVEGFHSYKNTKFGYKGYISAKKYHREADFSDYNDYGSGCVIIKCIIPKGANYYFNGTDYVSEALKPIGVIKQSLLSRIYHLIFS